MLYSNTWNHLTLLAYVYIYFIFMYKTGLLSEFLRRSLMIFIIKGFQTIVFIVISTTFPPICPPAFFRCFLSNLETYTELRIIESRGGVTCSDSVYHNRVQVLKILVLSCWVTLRNGYRSWFPKLQRRLSSRGCRFYPDFRRVTTQEFLMLVPGYG